MANESAPKEGEKTESGKAWLTIATVVIGAAVSLTVAYWQFDPKDKPNNNKDFVGRVVDAKTEQRIRGAKISLEADGAPPITYTDTEGVFSFPLKNPDEQFGYEWR